MPPRDRSDDLPLLGLKAKKKCCRSKPRCKRCPVRLRLVAEKEKKRKR